MSKSAEEHALAILKAIQTAEAAGYEVEVDEVDERPGLTVAGHFTLVQPVHEGDPWDMGVPS